MIPGAPLRSAGTARAGRFQRALPVLLAIASIASLAVGCAPSGTASPASTPAPGSPASGTPVPKPTVWPTTTVEATIALGAADGDFTTMADDVVAAMDSQDTQQILTVMNDVIEFLTENQKNVPRLQAYDATKSVGDRLARAYATMIEGATAVRDGLLAGNSDAVETGLTTFVEGNGAYVAISADLGDLAEQALFMKRQLLQ